MAEDDKDPQIGASHEGNNKQDEEHRELFIDRDDDSSSPFVDSDYGDEFPGSSDEPENVDPGYAAFSSELEDPLADWPSPDAPLEDLPEVRQQKEALDQRAATDAFEQESEPELDSDPRSQVQDSPNDESNDEVLLSFSSHSSDDAVFDDAHESADSSAPDVVDGDDVSAADSYDEPDLPAGDFILDDENNDKPLPEQNEAFDETEEGFEEEFVDDFLNDLDPPEEEELPEVDDFEDEFDVPMLATATIAASSVERAAPYDASEAKELDSESSHAAVRTVQTTAQEESRAFPLGMIAVVGVALVLLGIGGYGVMQQRGDMQAEIRDLQAKLATTISPEEAQAERERQRQIQLQNESLSTELEALSAENSALAQQLAELEATQAAQISAAAEKRAQEEAAAKAAAERAAQQAAAKKQAAAQSTASSASSAAAKGPWFVNFGSYADRTIAQRWANKLDVESGEVIVQTATAANKTLYRVRVIGLSSQDSAERVATALERQYQLPRLWVGKN
ncbi:SPOR domain-containing protein [Congregibacter variabilis]|uniref:SPOR domain-containing protein n=1 Tax=Congregibacter variabilis TaxID=3081200 RepID=A0ABZ0I0U4_9GAMM|nr:SPOR domain-containing protein [Congregibacter sp. IMCC43200]